jgi:hypothetical protein
LDSEDEGMFQTFFQWYIICFWTKSWRKFSESLDGRL